VKRISSRWTFFYKRVTPVIWFGILIFIVFTAAWTGGINSEGTTIAVIMFILMGFFGYFLMRQVVFDLVNEAWDAGDYLIFKNKGIEETVPLTNIMNMSYTVLINPPRVTLTLRTPSRLGKEITFSPPASMNPFNAFKKSPIVDKLIQRVDRARSR